MAITAPTLAALAIGTTALGATASFVQAREQNRSARRAAVSSRESAELQARQLDRQAELERAKRLREMEIIRGRIRVAAAESGFAPTSGDFERLGRQNEFDTTIDLDTMEENLANNQELLRSGLEARLEEISARTSNALLQALAGGMSGAAAGLQIGGGIKDIQEP